MHVFGRHDEADRAMNWRTANKRRRKGKWYLRTWKLREGTMTMTVGGVEKVFPMPDGMEISQRQRKRTH